MVTIGIQVLQLDYPGSQRRPEPNALDKKKYHCKNRSPILHILHWNIDTFFRV
jgi:hypothetical protein